MTFSLRNSNARAFCVVVLMALAACAGPAPMVDRSDGPVPDRETAFFAVPAEPLRPTMGRITRRGTYSVRRFTFDSVFHIPGAKPVEAFWYLPREGRRFPLVMILPITRGEHFSSEFAVFLAERGYACVRFRSYGDIGRLYEDPASLPLFRDLLRARVIDTRRVLDWAIGLREVDASRVGLVGFSHGALVGALVTAVDPRIRASALVLGGGDLAGIIRDSRQRSLARLRESVMADEGLTLVEFYETAAATLEDVDPLTYAPLVSPKKMLMINARWDRVILPRHSEALWLALGRPELVWLPSGHYTAALFTSYARHKIVAHFEGIFRRES